MGEDARLIAAVLAEDSERRNVDVDRISRGFEGREKIVWKMTGFFQGKHSHSIHVWDIFCFFHMYHTFIKPN